MAEMSCSRSSRPNVTENGLEAPAVGVWLPAVKDGLNGRLPGHAPPAPFQSTLNDDDGVASGVPAIASVPERPPRPGVLHGVRSVVVVNVPQLCGFANGALAPPLNVSSSSLKGSWGCCVNVACKRPVTGFADTWPASLTITPRSAERTCRNSLMMCPSSASVALHGEHSGSPMNTWPSSGFSSKGVVTFTVPIWEANGQDAGSGGS